jgi:hypothetical protein
MRLALSSKDAFCFDERGIVEIRGIPARTCFLGDASSATRDTTDMRVVPSVGDIARRLALSLCLEHI